MTLRRWQFVVAALGALAVAAALIGFRQKPTANAASSPASARRTARAERRDFVRTIRFHGVIEAARSQTITAPRLSRSGDGLVITMLAAAGARVAPGDLLAECDDQGENRAFLDRQSEYQDALSELARDSAERRAAGAEDETQLRRAHNAVETARLETRKNEILSRIEAEKNVQELEKAQARLAQVEATLETKRESRRAQRRLIELRRDRAQRAMARARRDSELMRILSPINGVVVPVPIWRGTQMAQVREGDEVRAGVAILEVVDPSAMRVRVRVNQMDLPLLAVGQPAVLSPDAFPTLRLPGRLESIGVIGIAGFMSERVRTFDAVFAVNESDPRVLPGLSAAVDVELERRAAATVIPRDALVWEGDRCFVRLDGAARQSRSVELLAGSDIEVVVSGVDSGTSVVRGEQSRGSWR